VALPSTACAGQSPRVGPAELEQSVMGLDSRRTPLDRVGRARGAAATDAGSTHPLCIGDPGGCGWIQAGDGAADRGRREDGGWAQSRTRHRAERDPER